MPKITKTGGPSYVGHEDGGGTSAAPFEGPPDAPKSAALTYDGHEPVPAEGEDALSPDPGTSSSESETKPEPASKRTSSESGSPARTTESRTAPGSTESPSAGSTATGRSGKGSHHQ